MTGRRFPPPWRADKIPGGYVVRDANGQALAYFYSRDNESEALQAKVLTKDEARRIAVNVARSRVAGNARSRQPTTGGGIERLAPALHDDVAKTSQAGGYSAPRFASLCARRRFSRSWLMRSRFSS
jgi:hypothetical protein